MESPSSRLSPELVALLTARGELVIQEGKFSESLFILLTGQLMVFTQDDRGREVIYNSLDAGEVLGEMFLDGGPRSASVRATSDAQCIEVRGAEIRTFMHQYPEFSEALVVKLIERLRHATLQIRSLALEGVFARTATAIEELAIDAAGQRYLPATITQQQIASRTGATREMVDHVVRDLLKAGVLVRDEHGGWLITKPMPKH